MANVKIEKETYEGLREIKKEILKATKYEEDVTVKVKVFDSDESDEQTFDVEINYYIDGQYEDGWINDTFYGEIENDEYNEVVKKQAIKRAKAVLKSVKGWFECLDVEVDNNIEVYHV